MSNVHSPLYITDWNPAYPTRLESENGAVDFCGLTKREYAAIAAMNGLIASDPGNMDDHEYVAMHALKNADALLAALQRRDV